MEVTVGFGSDFWFDCVALLVGCTIDCHSEISSSLVCSWTCAWIQFAWSCTTIGDRFQFVQSGPA